MNIILSGKQLVLTEALKEMVKQELSFLEELLSAKTPVTVTVEAKPVPKVSILFTYDHNLIAMDDSGEDLYQVFRRLAKKLEKQLKQVRKMKRDFVKGHRANEKWIPMATDELEDENEFVISKRKRFEMKPMYEAEAILQMQALGHKQFIFANAEFDSRICLLYTRKDSTFGLIETTI